MYCSLALRGTPHCLGYHATHLLLVMPKSISDALEATQEDYRRVFFGTALVHESACALAVAQWPKTLCHQAPMVSNARLPLRHSVGICSNLESITLGPSVLDFVVNRLPLRESRFAHKFVSRCCARISEQETFNPAKGHGNVLEAPSVDLPATCVVRRAVPKGLLNS